MVERQEVEEILESALRITGSPDVDNDTLAAQQGGSDNQHGGA